MPPPVPPHTTIVLAAGLGKRMGSPLPKVLQKLAGKPLIGYVLDLVERLNSVQTLLVVGHKKEMVMGALADRRVRFVTQEPQLGTGHAVMQALPEIANRHLPVLVLAGDTPLLEPDTLHAMLASHRQQDAIATVLVAEADNPFGCGRIILDERGYLSRIVEESDATPEQKSIKLVNTSTYVFQYQALDWALKQIEPNNAQGEYYLTDAIGILAESGQKVVIARAGCFEETLGINTPGDLERALNYLLSKSFRPQAETAGSKQ